jgi:uncharacterized LabA/DUF88 family protein
MESEVDVVVLASGDGDFVDLVNFLKFRMIRVEVMSFPRTTSNELKELADRFSPLGQEFLLDKDDKKPTE